MFTMGATQEDVMRDWNNVPRRITVNSFYIDQTEVANIHYREYLYWVTTYLTPMSTKPSAMPPCPTPCAGAVSSPTTSRWSSTTSAIPPTTTTPW